MFSIALSVSESIEIEKPLDEVFKFVGNFKNWKVWSPWLCQEPNCPVSIAFDPCLKGHSQTWDGSLIGSGQMLISDLVPNESIHYTLTFLKPWKSRSEVTFRFKELSSGATLVSWSMKGKLPFFLFFMKRMMEAWIGSDYTRGLSMLKEYLEKGRVDSKVTVFDEPHLQEAFYWFGTKRECSLDDLPNLMKKDFETLLKTKEKEKSLRDPKFAFSFYHKWDFVKKRAEYTSGLAYSHKVKDFGGFQTGFVKDHYSLVVEHLGSYRFLGNAWSAAIMLKRSSKRAHKKIPMYEVYVNLPGEVKEEELKTRIVIPTQ